LNDGALLGFICADRWMKNRYGGPLRNLVAKRFHLKVYVDMVDTPAFHSDVIAYPAITIISRETPGATRTAHRPDIDKATLTSLASLLRAQTLPKETGPVRELARVTHSAEPWLLESSDQIALHSPYRKKFPYSGRGGLQGRNWCRNRIGQGVHRRLRYTRCRARSEVAFSHNQGHNFW